MGLDGELAGILREVVQFLECLREVKLPVTLESIRDTLLLRSKETLTTFMAERVCKPGSPEPYLNMNAGSKGLLLLKTETELEEYVGAEEPKRQTDHYETFQNEPSVSVKESSKDTEQIDNTLVEIYSRMAATQTRGTCQKCGLLYRKEGKKLFVFEQYRAVWVGLVGSHLLMYGSDRDNRPYMIQPIRGYIARAAPNAIPRDQRRSESAFEICRPGSRTLQFIARTPKDMEQWVAQICQMNDKHEDLLKINNPADTRTSFIEVDLAVAENREDAQLKKERYQDVSTLPTDETFTEPVSGCNATTETVPKESETNPPPLPARIPRRLPSLPLGSNSSYEPEDEEDDIYHKIEDLRDAMHYQNLAKTEKVENNKEEPTTYDDVRAKKTLDEKKLRIFDRQRKSECEMTYDDIGNTVSKDRKSAASDDQDRVVSYDDVENVIPTTKSKSPLPEKPEELTKSPQKKSFLDRVRSRRESPRKVEKKAKRKTPTPPPPMNIEQPEMMYDDVTDLASQEPVQEMEYHCPPPPRPVYIKPPVMDVIEQELYDDVGACREKYKEEQSKMDQKVPGKLQNASTAIQGETETFVTCETFEPRGTMVFEDIEHYQTPKNNHALGQQEGLYDDIAILADFTARQRESFCKKDDDSRIQTTPEKKPWNRFVSGRKLKLNESTSFENNKALNGIDSAEDLNEPHSLIRMNTFQKLISKMENSLGKTSARTTGNT